MDALLVGNAGSSSRKFQIFGIGGGTLSRRIRGQLDGIGSRPRLRAADGRGAVSVARGCAPAGIPDLPAAIAETRARSDAQDGLTVCAIGHRVGNGHSGKDSFAVWIYRGGAERDSARCCP